MTTATRSLHAVSPRAARRAARPGRGPSADVTRLLPRPLLVAIITVLLVIVLGLRKGFLDLLSEWWTARHARRERAAG